MNTINRELNMRSQTTINERSKPTWRFEEEFRDSNATLTNSDALKIPKIFHWVWVGEDSLPEKDVVWLQSWRTHHPDWRFVIWCEHPGKVTVEGFESLPLPPLVNRKFFYEIGKWVTGKAILASRSDIVRYEVVARYGGIYLDTDVQCFKPISELLSGVSLFVSDEWGPNPGNYMFGATANHPAMWTVVRELGPHLNRIGDPVNAVDAAGPRYLNNHLRQYSSDLVIFPHMFFNPISAFDNPDLATVLPKCSFGNHRYDGKWYDRTKSNIALEFLK